MPPRISNTNSNSSSLRKEFCAYLCIFIFVTIFSTSAVFAAEVPGSTLKSVSSPPGKNSALLKSGNTDKAKISPLETASVAYDASRDLLSIRANFIPLGDLVRRISKKTSISIKVLSKKLLDEEIRFQIENKPLEAALKKLFKDRYNATYSYSAKKTTGKLTSRPRLSKIFILSRIAGTSPDRQNAGSPLSDGAAKITVSSLSSEPATASASVPESRPESNTDAGALLAAIEDKLGNWHPSNTPEDLENLKKDLEKLKELAPEQKPDPAAIAPVVDSLAGVLKDSELDTSLRVNAAEVLGLLGSERAVGPLTEVFRRKERIVRDAAASSLVKIGSPEAVGAVFKVFEEYRSFNMHASAIGALASSGEADALFFEDGEHLGPGAGFIGALEGVVVHFSDSIGHRKTPFRETGF